MSDPTVMLCDRTAGYTRSLQTALLFAATLLGGVSWGGGPADALPRQSLTSGSPCSTCHTSSQGGGMRTSIGWATGQSAAAISWEEMGVSFLGDRSSNEIADGVSAGFDARLQMARLGAPRVQVTDNGGTEVVTPDRRIIPMQLEPYVRAELLEWLDVEGSWSAGPSTFSDGEVCSTVYPGQTCGAAHATIDPGARLPNFRVGMLQPSFGIRHEDHTNLIRHDAARGDRSTLIPPNYADLGVETTWQPVHWLKADVSGILADNLSRAVGDRSVLDRTQPGASARVTFSPRIDTESIGSFYSHSGVSALGADEFLMVNGFVGLGWLDRASLIVEAAHLRYGGEQNRETWNFSSQLAVPIWDWLVLNGRVGQSRSVVDGSPQRTREATFGVEVYPVPWIELRPEYRIQRTNDWQMGQYTAQLHIFY